MAQLSYRRHRFPPEIIQHAIWLYLRFTYARVTTYGQTLDSQLEQLRLRSSAQ
jgi:hypothetical protein